MLRLFLRLFAAISFLTLAGCELTIDVDVPRSEPVLVVDGLFDTGSIWRIGLSQSTPVQDGWAGAEAQGVDNATVEIYEGDRLAERLVPCSQTPSCSQDPFFQNVVSYVSPSGRSPEPGVAYTLRVTHPDFAPIEASDTAPQPLGLARIDWTASHELRTPEFSPVVEYSSSVDIELRDTEASAHYALRFSLFETPSPQFPQARDEPRAFRSSAPIFLRSDIDLFDELDQRRFETAYFSDDLFANDVYSIRSVLDESYRCLTRDGPCQASARLLGRIYTISPTYFDYIRQFIAHDASGGEDNPLAEPVRVRGNVEGGLGIFAGRSATVFDLTPSDS